MKVCILNSVAPKLKPTTESLDAHSRNWYSQGYRTSVPSTNVCREDSDCQGTEICQSGFCAGLKRTYSTYGLYYDDVQRTPLNFHPHHFFYEYVNGKLGRVNRPFSSTRQREDTTEYNYDSAY